MGSKRFEQVNGSIDRGKKHTEISSTGNEMGSKFSADLQREAVLTELLDLGSHSVYPCETIVRCFFPLGLPITLAEDGKSVCIMGESVGAVEPEWGEPGVAPIDIAATLFKLECGVWPESKFTGRGFRFRDVLSQVARLWGVDDNNLRP